MFSRQPINSHLFLSRCVRCNRMVAASPWLSLLDKMETVHRCVVGAGGPCPCSPDQLMRRYATAAGGEAGYQSYG